jgi:hypothetical protein
VRLRFRIGSDCMLVDAVRMRLVRP